MPAVKMPLLLLHLRLLQLAQLGLSLRLQLRLPLPPPLLLVMRWWRRGWRGWLACSSAVHLSHCTGPARRHRCCYMSKADGVETAHIV
jgi:hypothetical protein